MKSNKMMNIGFMIIQFTILLMVLMIDWLAFRAITISVEKYDTSYIMYFPIILVAVIFPILLYKYQQMFSSGKFLISIIWLMGTSSFILLMLSLYVPQLV